MKSYLITVYSDFGKISDYGAYSEMSEEELEDYILTSPLWRELYDDYIDTQLANQEFDDEEEEWYDSIRLKIEEYDNLNWVDIVIDERKK